MGLLFFLFFSVLTCLCTKALHFSHFRGGAKGRPAVPPSPPNHYYYFAEIIIKLISIHYYYFREIIIIIDVASLLLFPRDNNNESKSIHYYYFREIIIMVRGGLPPPNELEDIRMNWASIFFRRHTNELEDIRMHWNTHNELGFSLFLGGKTYE